MRLRCEGCGEELVASSLCPSPFTCPAAVAGDDIDHLLVAEAAPLVVDESTDATFLRYREALAFATLPLGDAELRAIVERLDAAVAHVDGKGFRVTPAMQVEALGVRLTVKDETGNVAGSHKARHLMGILLWLEATATLGWTGREAPLAIASCGNAALAAAVLARAAGRVLQVFIPTGADAGVVERLGELGAEIQVCPRVPGVSGDPTWAAFQAAVARGAVPFCCQGPANGLTLDGGRTLAWELGAPDLDDVVLQVGGGALGSAVVRGLADRGCFPRVHVVQTAAVSPLARAVDIVRRQPSDLPTALDWARRHRSAVMWPWAVEGQPRSIATGILDDETFDWHRLVRAVCETGGRAVTVREETLRRAPAVLEEATGIRASPTGASGFAGLLELRRDGHIVDGARVLVIASGGRGRG